MEQKSTTENVGVWDEGSYSGKNNPQNRGTSIKKTQRLLVEGADDLKWLAANKTGTKISKKKTPPKKKEGGGEGGGNWRRRRRTAGTQGLRKVGWKKKGEKSAASYPSTVPM